jgi:hypothetical protein
VRHRNGSREEFRVAKLLGYQSLKRFELAEAARATSAPSPACRT